MTGYQWWADPDLAPLGSIVGVIIGVGSVYIYFWLKGEL